LSSGSATVPPRRLSKKEPPYRAGTGGIRSERRLRGAGPGPPCESPGPAPVPGRRVEVPAEEIGILAGGPLVDQHRNCPALRESVFARVTVTLALAGTKDQGRVPRSRDSPTTATGEGSEAKKLRPARG
jgi:hypothetical protein